MPTPPAIDGLIDWVTCTFRRRFGNGAAPEDPRLRILYERLMDFDMRTVAARPVDESRFVVIDTETTGFRAYGGDEIVSIALLELRGLRTSTREYRTLVRPRRPIPPGSTEIHGIGDSDVLDSPVLEEVLPAVLEFIDDAVLVGHHIAFDLRFLNRALLKMLHCQIPNPWLDTMLMYLAYSGRIGHYSLEEVAAHCDVEIRDRHTAYGDAAAAACIFRSLAARLSAPDTTVAGLVKRQHEFGQF